MARYKTRLPNLSREATRHGKLAWYVRIGKGARIRIESAYGTPEFVAEYTAAIAKLSAAIPVKLPPARSETMRWLIEQYKASGEYAAMKGTTKRAKDHVLKGLLESVGDRQIAEIDRAAVAAARDRRKDRPGAANQFLKVLSSLFVWAIDAGLCHANPASGVKRLPAVRPNGFAVWSEDEIAKYESRWPTGTRQRLFLDVLIYTGLRRADAARLGPEHVRGNTITIIAEKNGVSVTIPVAPALAESIRATTPANAEAFICQPSGKRLTVESFGNSFADACDAAGVPGSAHGLRKAAAVRLAMAGATERQLMSVFGWQDSDMASLYTRAADRARLGLEAGELLANTRREFDQLAA